MSARRARSKKSRRNSRTVVIFVGIAAFVAGLLLGAPSTNALQLEKPATVTSLEAAPQLAATTTAPLSSSSVCAPTVNVFGKPCVRIAELTRGSVFGYGTFYEAANRPLVSRVIATVRICGYGTNGTCRDLGAGYKKSYDMTAIFGRTCSVDVAGGWSGIASGSCQIQGPNYNLTGGYKYRAEVDWAVTRNSDGATFIYHVNSGWVIAQG